VPLPWLEISRTGPASLQLSWATNFADFLLESATQLPTLSWSVVTNAPSNAGDRMAATLDIDANERCYRLRKP
jgi:hypothetical protein